MLPYVTSYADLTPGPYGDLDPGENYLYHYTSAATLALILDSGELRLGPYSQTRDPRENQKWMPMFSAVENEDVSSGEWDMSSLPDLLDAAIRQRAKLACLTLDQPTTSFLSLESARGYGRPRMWEQYADNHRGAVLIFHHESLDQAVESSLGQHVRFQKPVIYSDDARHVDHAMHFRLRDIHTPEALALAAETVIKSHGTELFFGKLTDWATEREYRYVVVSDKCAEFVPIKESLAGIVVGTDFPSQESSVLRYRLEKLGRPGMHLAQLSWLNGQPMTVPYLQESAETRA
jgi:hypothetical protein